jgi:hypothetical protein
MVMLADGKLSESPLAGRIRACVIAKHEWRRTSSCRSKPRCSLQLERLDQLERLARHPFPRDV